MRSIVRGDRLRSAIIGFLMRGKPQDILFGAMRLRCRSFKRAGCLPPRPPRRSLSRKRKHRFCAPFRWRVRVPLCVAGRYDVTGEWVGPIVAQIEAAPFRPGIERHLGPSGDNLPKQSVYLRWSIHEEEMRPSGENMFGVLARTDALGGGLNDTTLSEAECYSCRNRGFVR